MNLDIIKKIRKNKFSLTGTDVSLMAYINLLVKSRMGCHLAKKALTDYVKGKANKL